MKDNILTKNNHFQEMIMGTFGNTTADLNLNRDRTETEKIIDYTCGPIFLITTVIGLIANTILIHYYQRHRTAWMHKFFYALAIVNWVYMIVRGVPTTIVLLNPDLALNKSDQLEEVINIMCYLDGSAETIILAAIIVVQHTNIYYPGWTLLNGPSTCWLRIIIAGITVCFFFFAPALAFLFVNFNNYVFLDELMFNLPLLMIKITSLCVYIATRIKFRSLERELSIEVQEKVRREFKLVDMLAIWCLIWFSCTVFFLKLVYKDGKDLKYLPVKIDIFICNQIVPMIEFTTVSCAMFWFDQGVWDFTFRGRRRQGYAILN